MSLVDLASRTSHPASVSKTANAVGAVVEAAVGMVLADGIAADEDVAYIKDTLDTDGDNVVCPTVNSREVTLPLQGPQRFEIWMGMTVSADKGAANAWGTYRPASRPPDAGRCSSWYLSTATTEPKSRQEPR